MLSAISLVTEQRKNEFDRIATVWFPPPSICIPCEGNITFRTPARIYCTMLYLFHDLWLYKIIPKNNDRTKKAEPYMEILRIRLIRFTG